MNALGEFLLSAVSTVRAVLTGVCGMDGYHNPRGSFSLRGQDGAEHTPTGIRNGLGEAVVLDHACDVEGFNGNQAKAVDELTERDERPFTSRTKVAIPYCGSTSHKICTWSGITSTFRIIDLVSSATPRMISFNRSSTGGVSASRRYLGQKTMWYLQEYVQLLFDLKSRSI